MGGLFASTRPVKSTARLAALATTPLVRDGKGGIVNGTPSVLDRLLPVQHGSIVVSGSTVLFVACNVLAALAFRWAAHSATWSAFLGWQIVGNLAGFITVLALTVLLRFLPLSWVYPITTGLSVIAVQVIAASLLLHEPLPTRVWLGTALIVVGILLVGGRL